MKTILRFVLIGLAFCVMPRPGKAEDWQTIGDEIRLLMRLTPPDAVVWCPAHCPPCGQPRFDPPPPPARVVNHVEYHGARHVSEDELAELSGIGAFTRVNSNRNKFACGAIVEHLRVIGYPFAECRCEEVVMDYCLDPDRSCRSRSPFFQSQVGHPDEWAIKFQINEGPHVKIHDVNFDGNKTVDSAVLSAALTPQCEPIDGPISGSELILRGSAGLGTPYQFGVFDVRTQATRTDASIVWLHDLYRVWGIIAADADRIRVLYDRFDYHAARVWCEPHLDAAGIGVTLIYHIEEGSKGRMSKLVSFALPWDF
jgi:hypothetical protein